MRRLTLELFGSDRASRPSLHGIEAKLDALFAGRPGFFVEAGAFDGFAQSNTYWLERFRGWHGVLVEPLPSAARRCRRLRGRSAVLQVALVAQPASAGSALVRGAGLMSFVSGARGTPEADDAYVQKAVQVQGPSVCGDVRVPTMTLTEVLERTGAPGRFELLSLDVEGTELAVLEGLDVERFRPQWIVVEYFETPGVHELLETMGYELVDEQFTPQDRLYRARSA